MLKTTAPIFGPVLAGAMALSTITATPAQASSDDLAKVLLGLTALTILGAALADNDPAPAAPATRYYAPPRPVPVAPPVVKRPLPSQCLQAARIDGRARNVYGKACLSRHYRHVERLPQACRATVRIYGKLREVFRVGCLRSRGWPV